MLIRVLACVCDDFVILRHVLLECRENMKKGFWLSFDEGFFWVDRKKATGSNCGSSCVARARSVLGDDVWHGRPTFRSVLLFKSDQVEWWRKKLQRRKNSESNESNIGHCASLVCFAHLAVFFYFLQCFTIGV